MRVLFVSDTHLGLDSPARPRVVRRRRGDDFFRNLDRALGAVADERIDVVVHGGDLFFRSRVPAALAEAALTPLKRVAAAGIPVLFVPGNHERSRLPCPLLALQEGLHVFDRPRTLVFESRGLRVAFTGFPYTPRIRSRFRDAISAAGPATAADVRVLCMHHCVEGATCGPGNFTFRSGDDVIRTADLPRDVAVVLSGHIHRHQILRPEGRPPVVYAGSVERTSFAEAAETKGFVVLELSRAGVENLAFRPLPARPMVRTTIALQGLNDREALARVAGAVEATPPDAVVQLQVEGPWPAGLTAATLRALGGARNITLAPARAFSSARHAGRGAWP